MNRRDFVKAMPAAAPGAAVVIGGDAPNRYFTRENGGHY